MGDRPKDLIRKVEEEELMNEKQPERGPLKREVISNSIGTAVMVMV
jgi:hypothetical protein